MLNLQYSNLNPLNLSFFGLFSIISISSPPASLSDSGWKVSYFISNWLQFRSVLNRNICNIHNICSEILVILWISSIFSQISHLIL